MGEEVFYNILHFIAYYLALHDTNIFVALEAPFEPTSYPGLAANWRQWVALVNAGHVTRTLGTPGKT
jgi:hypothetical protein